MLTPKEMLEFKVLVKKVYGIELTDEEAEEQGSRLIQLFEFLMKYSPQLTFETINSSKKVVQKDEE